MIKRYENQKIAKIWSDEESLLLWQRTELAAIKARMQMGEIDPDVYETIEQILTNTPIDLNWWRDRDKEIHHDLNAFIDERVRYLPIEYHEHFHKKLTSYDTQEPAFASKLFQSFVVIDELYDKVAAALAKLARKYRYTIMNARTHGQEAELQTFGARCLAHLAEFSEAGAVLYKENRAFTHSKLSGAIGKYGSLDPELERRTLAILGLEPFYGATQIMPRIVYLPIAQGMCAIVQALNNIAMNIRLNARSGRPLVREPFGKKQKGSSAMPHKKNPIRCEQMEGLERMARNYLHMIEENIRTWEERDIAQSSVERIAWPDLFHVTARALSEMALVLEGLQVYPDNMLLEVHESRGVYASSEVKEFLKERMIPMGFTYEDAYRVVQLACFNVFELPPDWQDIRETVPTSFSEAAALLVRVTLSGTNDLSIQQFIPHGMLRVSDELEIAEDQVHDYNLCLRNIFSDPAADEEWNKLFDPAEVLKNEATLYHKILGE